MTIHDVVKLLGWLAVAGVLAMFGSALMGKVQHAAKTHLP